MNNYDVTEIQCIKKNDNKKHNLTIIVILISIFIHEIDGVWSFEVTNSPHDAKPWSGLVFQCQGL